MNPIEEADFYSWLYWLALKTTYQHRQRAKTATEKPRADDKPKVIFVDFAPIPSRKRE